MTMRKFKIVVFIFGGLVLAYFGARIFRSISVEENVTEFKTEHFVISHHGIYQRQAQDIADNLEKQYIRIRSELGDTDHQPIRVFIHPTQDDFNKGTGLPNSTANGTSRGPNEFHLIWTNWFNSIFPDDPIKTAIHEFTHCVQLNILIRDAQIELANLDKGGFEKAFEEKFIRKYPQWFWEAICDYEAGIVNSVSVKYGMSKNPTLKSLNNSNQVYNVGYTIIEYVVEKWGRDKLPALITSYVDIEAVLKISASEFEKGWVEFVDEKY
jgi:hypothetical protein